MFRRVLAVLALIMTLTLSGCYSIIAGVGVVELGDSDESGGSGGSGSADSGKYVITNTASYPAGKDAFYVDETKCVKSEIEEFHLMALCSTTTMYYYTAKSTKTDSGQSGYYCLATYDYENSGSYTVLVDGYYNKENGNASMACDIDSDGTGIACIGSTFVSISNMSLENTFSLSGDQCSTIKNAVDGDFICYDIAVSDYYGGLFRAAFIRVPDENSEDDDFDAAVYRISHSGDTTDMSRVGGGTDSSTANICDSYNGSSGEYMSIVLTESDGEDENTFKFYIDKNEKGSYGTSATCSIDIDKNSDEESLLGFSLEEMAGSKYLLLLYDNRVELQKIEYKKKMVGFFKWALRPNSASRIATIALDNGMNYLSFNDTPSIVMQSTSKIYTCSLKNGFRCFTSGADTKTFANGAYYAAYSTDGANCTLIGFNTTTVNTTTTTSKNGTVLSTKKGTREINGTDLPFAKVYSVYVGASSFPVNAGTIAVAQPEQTETDTSAASGG